MIDHEVMVNPDINRIDQADEECSLIPSALHQGRPSGLQARLVHFRQGIGARAGCTSPPALLHGMNLHLVQQHCHFADS